MIEQLSEAIRAAAASGTPLTIRGSASKDFYGRETPNQALDVSGYRGIVEYEPSELVITARGGTPLEEVECALAERGQCLAFEPPRFNGGGTWGGAIAAGLSGPRRAYAGAARDFVLGVRVLNGEGKDLSFGGRVIKNVAGFDLSRLIAGSLGTLGVILEASLKVLPRPPAEVTRRFETDEAAAIRTVNEWAGKPLPISATCFHDGVLWVRLSGADAAVQAAGVEQGGEIVTDGAAFWDSLRDQTHSFFAGPDPLWRVSVPTTAPPLKPAVPQLIEWGGGQRWLRGDLDAAQLRRQVAELGGHASLFRGGNRAGEVFQPLPPAMAALHRRIKAALDPKGILNPGRLYVGL